MNLDEIRIEYTEALEGEPPDWYKTMRYIPALIEALEASEARVRELEGVLGYGRGYLQAVVGSKADIGKDAKEWEHAFVGALLDLQEFSVKAYEAKNATPAPKP